MAGGVEAGTVRRWGVAMAIGFAMWVRPAGACGGPETMILDTPLGDVDRLLVAITTLDDGFESTPRDELRFLYPFRRVHPRRFGVVWQATYEYHADDEALPAWTPAERGDPARWEAAAQAGDLPRCLQIARKIVARYLELPSDLTAGAAGDFRQAVELLELAPLLRGADAATLTTLLADEPSDAALAALPAPVRAALAVRTLSRPEIAALAEREPQHPRRATLRFVALQEAMRTQIADGWFEDLRQNTPKDVWPRLRALHERWLVEFPKHPLADLVRLSVVRLASLEGNADAAWAAAFAVYPRRLARTARELRQLVFQEMLPSDLGRIEQDPVLLAAVLPALDVKRANWTRYWQQSLAGGTAAWVVPLQERLLLVATHLTAAGEPLPDGFPATAAVPSPVWAKFRLLALLGAGRADDAAAQAAIMPHDAESALLAAAVALRHGKVADAARAPGLEATIASYLVRVLADDAALDALAKVPEPAIRSDARMTSAVRRIAAQGFGAAGAGDAAHASRWQEAHRLGADPTLDGRLAYARWLRAHDGQLFYGTDKVWYRSLNYRLSALACQACAVQHDTTSEGCMFCDPEDATRDPHLPFDGAAEREAIRRHLRSSSETFLALQAYAGWLAVAKPEDPRLPKVVKEADAVYNQLVNWDNSNSQFWQHELEHSDIAVMIRRAGAGAVAASAGATP